jgi:lipid-binding SYLF domain-containing protein
VEEAAATVRNMRANYQFRALDSFLSNARGVIIFPQILKGAILLVGHRGGNGVLVARDYKGNWSAPAFYTLGGASFGPQLGVKKTALVLVIMNQAKLMEVINSGLTLGVDASVAAGSRSAGAEASTFVTAKDVYYFADVEGVFVGASLDGGVVKARNSYNEAYYGVGATPRDIILERRYSPETKVLEEALTTTGQ